MSKKSKIYNPRNDLTTPIKKLKKLFNTPAFYCGTSYGCLRILIPKKRGKGFLKTPVWHGHNDLSRFIQDTWTYDCCGLDGSLDIDRGVYGDNDDNIVDEIKKFLKLDKYDTVWLNATVFCDLTIYNFSNFS